MKQFNVIIWDINKNDLVAYDVLPFFRREYETCRKKERPVTREQWVEFVKRWGHYMYWARCEYEIIISQWPPASEERDRKLKIDVWQQIKNNLDIVVDILMEEHND